MRDSRGGAGGTWDRRSRWDGVGVVANTVDVVHLMIPAKPEHHNSLSDKELTSVAAGVFRSKAPLQANSITHSASHRVGTQAGYLKRVSGGLS